MGGGMGGPTRAGSFFGFNDDQDMPDAGGHLPPAACLHEGVPRGLTCLASAGSRASQCMPVSAARPCPVFTFSPLPAGGPFGGRHGSFFDQNGGSPMGQGGFGDPFKRPASAPSQPQVSMQGQRRCVRQTSHPLPRPSRLSFPPAALTPPPLPGVCLLAGA